MTCTQSREHKDCSEKEDGQINQEKLPLQVCLDSLFAVIDVKQFAAEFNLQNLPTGEKNYLLLGSLKTQVIFILNFRRKQVITLH